MLFDGTQKTIGNGAQAEVVFYRGYAYKIYRPSYPSEWIAFEKRQQREVNRALLSPVRYYDTDDDHIIRMDYIEGETLERRARNGDLTCFDILARSFRFIHGKDISGIDMLRLADTAAAGLDECDRGFVLSVIDKLAGKLDLCVCHLDLHFMNIMIGKEDSYCTVIDWINARLAPAVFDYARTYVILEEESAEAVRIYEKSVLPQMWASGVTEEDFDDAAEVCSVIRKREKKK